MSNIGLLVQLPTPSSIAYHEAGHLDQKSADPCVSIETTNSDFTKAAKMLLPSTDFNEIVFRVGRGLYSLWVEIHRLAVALDRDGV